MDTGSREAAIMQRSSLWERESMFSTSNGPKRSRAWKAGKTTAPYLSGTLSEERFSRATHTGIVQLQTYGELGPSRTC